MLRTSRGVRLAALVVWAAAIFAASSIPGSGLPATGLAPVAHFVEYAVLAGLIMWTLLPERGDLASAALAVALAVLYGLSDELHQAFVPGRTPDPADVLVDLIGAVFGALLVRWWATRD